MSGRSALFVAVQVAAVAYLLFTGPILPTQALPAVVELLGIAVAVWGIAVLRVRNLNIAPEVRQGGMLVTSGPYHYVRHPMYSGLLLVCLMWIVEAFSWWRLAAWAVLAGDILMKMRYEEGRLLAAFPDYESYRKRTKRLIPFLY